MQRIITHIILALFLLGFSTGTRLSLHYCGGELISTSINTMAESCCDEAGGCCENKTVQFQVKDDYLIPDQVNTSVTVQLDILFPLPGGGNIGLLKKRERRFCAFPDLSPPPILQIRLALLQTYLC